MFPPGGAPADAIRWYDAIFPYTHNSQILYCPDRKDAGPGYGMNPLMRDCPISSLWDAASKILCGDVDPALLYPAGSSGNGYPSAVIQPTNWWINDPHNTLCAAPQDNSFTGNNIPQRHNDGIVYGYADGHAKWGREETMAQAKYWQPAAQ